MLRWLALIDRLCVWLGIAAGVALTFLALFTIVDIFFRYVVNAPIFGSIDIIQLALAVMTFCALPYAGRTEGHIVIDLVPDFPRPRVTAWRDAATRLLTAIIFALLAWQAWLRGDESVLMGEASNMRGIPLVHFFQLLAACAGIYAMALLTEVAILIGGRRPTRLTVGLDEDEGEAGSTPS